MVTEFWIEKGCGVSIDNATITDINVAIEELITIDDDEHNSFWIGHTDQEYVLKIHKNLDLVFIYGENQDKQSKTKLPNWDQARYFIQIYFSKDFLLLKNEIESLSFSKIKIQKK